MEITVRHSGVQGQRTQKNLPHKRTTSMLRAIWCQQNNVIYHIKLMLLLEFYYFVASFLFHL